MTMNSRRGRLPASERADREAAILDVAQQRLVDLGVDGLTMLDVAQHAGASKQTLYAWFGDRDGLLRAIILRNADGAADAVRAALDSGLDTEIGSGHEVRSVLERFAVGLLTLLTRPESIALNRAAMQSPALAAELLQSGRHRVGPIVENFLARCSELGLLCVDDPSEAFSVLYGATIRDTQIRVLLGEVPPSGDEIVRRATDAVADFVRRYGVESN